MEKSQMCGNETTPEQPMGQRKNKKYLKKIKMETQHTNNYGMQQKQFYGRSSYKYMPTLWKKKDLK